jgi:hypothetical protein
MYLVNQVTISSSLSNAPSQIRFCVGVVRYLLDSLLFFDIYRFQILDGNRNTYVPCKNQLNPPIIATKIRVLPYSLHLRTICMRVELHGCNYTGESNFLFYLRICLIAHFRCQASWYLLCELQVEIWWSAVIVRVWIYFSHIIWLSFKNEWSGY